MRGVNNVCGQDQIILAEFDIARFWSSRRIHNWYATVVHKLLGCMQKKVSENKMRYLDAMRPTY